VFERVGPGWLFCPTYLARLCMWLGKFSLAIHKTRRHLMQILGVGHNISWLPLPNEIALILDDQLPPLAAITSALALAFDGERILMTNLRQRGWDISGGHLDLGETPEAAMRRLGIAIPTPTVIKSSTWRALLRSSSLPATMKRANAPSLPQSPPRNSSGCRKIA
jgi:hypothetical protein